MDGDVNGQRDPREVIATFAGAIRTDRLRLVATQVADADGLFEHFNDWEIVRWLARPDWPQDRANFAASLAQVEEDRLNGEALLLSVMGEDGPVGVVAWSVEASSSHLGYWIGQRYWGRGYVTEAAGALCDFVFAQTAVAAIHSGVFVGNAASLRVQAKLGFIQIGTSVHHCVPRGMDVAHIDTKLTRTARRVVLERQSR